jgi:hypothetical protein
MRFVQALVYKESGGNMLLAICAYNERSGAEVGSGLAAAYRSIDIIEDGERAKGVLISRMGTFIDTDESPGEYWYIIKGQPAGGVKAYYMLMDWIGDTLVPKRPVRGGGNEYLPGNARYIEITGSNCLIDLRSPLRYGLASAFDGDPATSYVENTEDDLMLITFYIENSPLIRRMAVINGYAQNPQIYQANNRIKIFIASMVDKILDDGILSYQYIRENTDLLFNVKEIYKGNTYNDTCLAELNFLTADGWLFGDISE